MGATTKPRARVGDIRWQVEWCSALVFDECGDVDRDACKMSRKTFATRDEARAFAESVYPQATETFGVVEVDEIEFVAYDDDDADTMPHVGYWQHIGETEYFSGEWET